MAGTVTVSERSYSSLKKIKFDWVSSGGGLADGPTLKSYEGVILRVVHLPGAGGVQPTNGYGVTILDSDGLDVLFGASAAVSNAAASQANTGLGCVAGGVLTIHVSGAGSAKSGSTIIYLR